MWLPCNQICQDKPTWSGHIYTKAALERVVEQSNKASETSNCFIVPDELQHLHRVRLSDVVGRVLAAAIADGRMHADVELLDTPLGRPLRALPAERSLKWSVGPVLHGTTFRDERGDVVDIDSLLFISWVIYT